MQKYSSKLNVWQKFEEKLKKNRYKNIWELIEDVNSCLKIIMERVTYSSLHTEIDIFKVKKKSKKARLINRK